MRKRESVWVDPRFRKKKDRPKAIKLNLFGEAPCEIPSRPISRPVPSAPCPPGTRRPPAVRPGTASRPGTAGMSRGAVSRPPGGTMSLGGGVVPPPQARAPPGLTRGAAAQSTPMVMSPRPPSPQRQTGGRQYMYRPSTAKAARSVTAALPIVVASPSSGLPETCLPEPSTQVPCLPDPCSPRPSGLPRRTGLRPPMVGRSGLRPPSASTAANITVRRARSPAPTFCPPSVAEECQPSAPDPCMEITGISAIGPAAQVPTAQMRRPAFQSRLAQPSRLMAPGSRMPQPKPQKIVLLPGDINPQETTIITVEPPPPPFPAPRIRSLTQQPMYRSPRRSPSPCAPADPDLLSDFPFDPAMDAFMREQLAPRQVPCPESTSDLALPTVETSTGLLIDFASPDPCTLDPQIMVEPVDLIAFDANDPFSPERAQYLRPPSPSVTPPPHPFSPPKSPLPELSELDKRYGQYPRYNQAFTKTFHPVTEWSRLKRDQSAAAGRSLLYVDREVTARTVPFNKNVSTICKDDDYDDELGLLPDFTAENFCAPLDYEDLRRQDEEMRQIQLAKKQEQLRIEKGPSLAETREMLARIRETEGRRRAQYAEETSTPYLPPALSDEQARDMCERIMAKAAGPQVSWRTPPEAPADPCDYTLLQEIQMDDIDLDAIELMDDCANPFPDPC